ncbi:redox-regulated ATPase YchF [Calditrichota bacterium]
MQCAIVGPHLSGKSTLFNILTGTESDAHSGTTEVRRGVAKIRDSLLDKLSQVMESRKTVYATVEYVDIPGTPAKTSSGDTYSTKALADLRSCDMLAMVVRAFVNEAVPHPAGSVDPSRDIEEGLLEFALNDLATIEKRLDKLRKSLTPEIKQEIALLEKCQAPLSDGVSLRDVEFSEAEQKAMRSFAFLSRKPILVVVNIGEDQVAEAPRILADLQTAISAGKQDIGWVTVAAEIEAEIAMLDDEERSQFIADLGFEQSAIDRITQATAKLLGLINFYTAGEKESRSWLIRAGWKAPQAAGVIHGDMERGFIRAVVCDYDDLLGTNGSFSKLKDVGKLRLEGKEYVVKEHDVLEIRFNV